MPLRAICLLIACSSSAHGLSSPVVARLARRASGGVRNVSPAMDFGDSFYEGFDAWAAEYPEEVQALELTLQPN
eukprot:926550-Prymnesium_polylepis.2